MDTLQKRDISVREIEHLHFASEDVYTSSEDITRRWYQLNMAMKLGNLEKVSSKILFQNASGELLRVESTVWATTAQNVILKYGMMIPIRAIKEVY